MDKKDFRNLLSKAFEKNNKKIDRKLELQTKRIRNDVREEFSHFVGAAIVPQFDRIYAELREIKDWVNDLSHSQGRMLNILEKHEDRLERIEAKLS